MLLLMLMLMKVVMVPVVMVMVALVRKRARDAHPRLIRGGHGVRPAWGGGGAPPPPSAGIPVDSGGSLASLTTAPLPSSQR